MTKLEEAVAVLTELEARFDVNAILYGGFRAWPVVRYQLWAQLAFGQTGLAAAAPAPSRPASRLLRAVTRGAGLLLDAGRHVGQRRGAPWATSQALFYSRAAEHFTRIGSEHVALHCDPIQELVEPRMRCCKLELETALGHRRQPRERSAVLLSPHHGRRLHGLMRRLRPARLRGVEGLASLTEEISGASGVLDEERLLEACRIVDAHATLFERLLSGTPVRTVFSVCYYGPDGMGLTLACRRLGIRSVDVQHGKQGKFQGLYSHWTRIPPQGYGLLPDRFWVWGEESAANILESRGGPSQHHLPVVGGFPWLRRWEQGARYRPNAAEERLLAWAKGAERAVLVSLQPLPELPSHLVAAMRDAPSSWRWLIRLHPNRADELKPRFREQLAEVPAERFEMEECTRAPLHFLLGQVTHHVTPFSSVCYEALALGVPSLVIDPVARTLYPEYIAQGAFVYCDTSPALLAALSAEERPPLPTPPYIETAPAISESALNELLEHS